MRTTRTGGSKGFDMKDSTIDRTILESAWLAVVQIVAEHERAGQDVRHLRSLERELRTALDFDGLDLAA